jgi:hypothetical protein
MKNKGLIITTIAFFLYVNTKQYWIGKTEPFGFPIILIGAITLLGLVIALTRQIYLTTKEKGSDRSRILILGLLAIVVALTFCRPAGLIDFGL